MGERFWKKIVNKLRIKISECTDDRLFLVLIYTFWVMIKSVTLSLASRANDQTMDA